MSHPTTASNPLCEDPPHGDVMNALTDFYVDARVYVVMVIGSCRACFTLTLLFTFVFQNTPEQWEQIELEEESEAKWDYENLINQRRIAGVIQIIERMTRLCEGSGRDISFQKLLSRTLTEKSLSTDFFSTWESRTGWLREERSVKCVIWGKMFGCRGNWF